MVPLSALTNMEHQHQGGIHQGCCMSQVSSTTPHGQNVIHASPHAPMCSMGPVLNRGQLYHCLSDGNGIAAVNPIDGMFTAQHQQPSHSNGNSGVILNMVPYPKVTKPSMVSESTADTNHHPQGPLPPTPVDPDASITEDHTMYLMELPSRPASAGAAAIQAVSSLGLDAGYQNHVGQRQPTTQQQFSTFFHQPMNPIISNQGVPAASSIGCLPANGGGNGGGNSSAIKRESTGKSGRRGNQLRKQQSISCAYEYCDDKMSGPVRHQPKLQSINDLGDG